jgi:hypothetical protein
MWKKFNNIKPEIIFLSWKISMKANIKENVALWVPLIKLNKFRSFDLERFVIWKPQKIRGGDKTSVQQSMWCDLHR